MMLVAVAFPNGLAGAVGALAARRPARWAPTS
jgi:hypothetical protein